jgi:hypothetical protein
MALKSKLFKGDPKLEACALSHPAHITKGAAGAHVAKIQTALIRLDGTIIDRIELRSFMYGRSTAAAVLKYKQRRKIINRSYQTQADNIVGIMTIAKMDEEILALEKKDSVLVTVQTFSCAIADRKLEFA